MRYGKYEHSLIEIEEYIKSLFKDEVLKNPRKYLANIFAEGLFKISTKRLARILKKRYNLDLKDKTLVIGHAMWRLHQEGIITILKVSRNHGNGRKIYLFRINKI